MLPEEVESWSIGDVENWLDENNLSGVATECRDHEIDGTALNLLRDSDIDYLIKKIGPRVKFRHTLSVFLDKTLSPTSKKDFIVLQHGLAADQPWQPKSTAHHKDPNRRLTTNGSTRGSSTFIDSFAPRLGINNPAGAYQSTRQLPTFADTYYEQDSYYPPNNDNRNPRSKSIHSNSYQTNSETTSKEIYPTTSRQVFGNEFKNYEFNMRAPTRYPTSFQSSHPSTHLSSHMEPPIIGYDVAGLKIDPLPIVKPFKTHTQEESMGLLKSPPQSETRDLDHHHRQRFNDLNEHQSSQPVMHVQQLNGLVHSQQQQQELSQNNLQHQQQKYNTQVREQYRVYEKTPETQNDINASAKVPEDTSLGEVQDSEKTEDRCHDEETNNISQEENQENVIIKKENNIDEGNNHIDNNASHVDNNCVKIRTDEGEMTDRNESSDKQFQHENSINKDSAISSMEIDEDISTTADDLFDIDTSDDVNIDVEDYDSDEYDEEHYYKLDGESDSNPSLAGSLDHTMSLNADCNLSTNGFDSNDKDHMSSSADSMSNVGPNISNINCRRNNPDTMRQETYDGSISMVSINRSYERVNYPRDVIEVGDVSYNTLHMKNQPMKHEMKDIEAVTNRLALRERSKIFRRSEKKWHIAVNETAYQMVMQDPKLIRNKKELRLRAEAEVRKTYKFAKGKSRSIALPENKLAADARKKQKLTNEKIMEMKRALNSDAEEVSRQMRQCHMNLTLAGQQTDTTKLMHLREEMQSLQQRQAKIHFDMDEILKKERKMRLAVKSQKNETFPNKHMKYNSMGKPLYIGSAYPPQISHAYTNQQPQPAQAVQIVQNSSVENQQQFVQYSVMQAAAPVKSPRIHPVQLSPPKISPYYPSAQISGPMPPQTYGLTNPIEKRHSPIYPSSRPYNRADSDLRNTDLEYSRAGSEYNRTEAEFNRPDIDNLPPPELLPVHRIHNQTNAINGDDSLRQIPNSRTEKATEHKFANYSEKYQNLYDTSDSLDRTRSY